MEKYTINDGIDPLSFRAITPATKKEKNVSRLEEMLKESEKSLLGANDLPNNMTDINDKKESNGLINNPNYTQPPKPRYLFGQANDKTDKNDKKPSTPNPTQAEVTKKSSMIDDNSPFYKPSESKIRLEDLGFKTHEIIPGEEFLSQYPAYMTTTQYPSLNIDGNIVVTKYRVCFFPSDMEYLKKKNLREDFFMIPLGFIYKIDKTTVGEKKLVSFLEIYSKDGRQFKFRITEVKYNDSQSLILVLDKFVFIPPTNKELFFAFEYAKKNKKLDHTYGGWDIYNIKKEFTRQGLKIAPEGNTQYPEYPYRYLDNKTFKYCSSYPSLLVVPNKASENIIMGSMKFRSKQRIPVITYYHAYTNAVLARCSQCETGITQKRSNEDEILLKLIGNSTSSVLSDDSNMNNSSLLGAKEQKQDITVHIYDARPYLNAVANKVNGKGYEDPKFYKNCEIFFMDIENIHYVRDSHKKLLSLCIDSQSNNSKWLSNLENTGWLQIIAYVLNAAMSVVNSILIGKSVLVHCSDGWDRASQIVALAQLLLDPYYRTIQGFEVLIEKDFCSFGHQFAFRMAHGVKNEKTDQRSPIFLQFLDCVHQIHTQYPYAFEFNQKFLTDIAYHSYTCQFGTFLCNSYQEQLTHKVRDNTVSLWSYLNSQKEKYLNMLYTPIQDLLPKKVQNKIWRESDPETLKRLLEESINMNKTNENSPIKLENLSTEAYLMQMLELQPDVLRPSLSIKRLRLWEEYFLYYSTLSLPLGLICECTEFNDEVKEYFLMKKINDLQKEIELQKEKLNNQSLKDNGLKN